MAARALVVAVALAFAATASGCTCRRANGVAEGEVRAPVDERGVEEPRAGDERDGDERAAGPRASVEERSAAEPRAAVLRGSAQCGGASRDGDARWVGSEEEYRAALAELERGRLPGTAPPPAQVDFGTHGVLIVRMGARPTAGYALELASDEVVTDGGTGAVRVNWTEPPEDGMVAQVLTSPCLLIAVRKEGLRAIKVVDQAGRARGTVELR
jgi:hypothetical protein